MKKIYLLLLLCLLSIRGFSNRWYSIVNNGDMTLPSTWSSNDVTPAFEPTFRGGFADTWIVQCNIYLPDGGDFDINGTLVFEYGMSVLRKGASPDTMHIGRSLFMLNPTSFYSGPGFITSVPGAGPFTLTVGNDLILQGSSFITDSTSNGTTINLSGNLRMEGSAFISSAATSPPGYTIIKFTGMDTLAYASPQTVTWTSTGVSKYTSFEIDAPDTVELESDVPLATLGASPPAGAAEILSGELICNTFGMNGDGTQTFNINTGASIYTANTGGMDSSVKRCTDFFSDTAHYIFNGTAPQITGITLPDSIKYSGTVRINDPVGVTLSKALTFYSRSDTTSGLYLVNGVMTIGVTDSLLTVFQDNVKIDTGTFSSAPTYVGGGVSLYYESLGYDALAVTTGYELLPVTPDSAEIFLIVTKPGATITLGSTPSVVVSHIGLWAGNLDASINNYDLTVCEGWYNISGPNAFVARAATVNFVKAHFSPISGTDLFGSFPTTFNNVTVNNSNGLYLYNTLEPLSDEIINGTLTLDSGNVYIYSHNLIFDTSATAVAGPPSSFSKIVADSTGQVRKRMTADGTFLYPVGDSINYSPITLAYSGSAGYDSGAFAAVNVYPVKEPHNGDATSYINRYWRVTDSGIVTPSYTATATYVTVDVVGAEADMAMGEWDGALPWIQYGLTNPVTHTLTSGVVTDSTVADFTGINATFPTLTLSDDTTICVGGFDTLMVLSSTGDTPYTYVWAPAASLSASTGTVVAATPTVTTTYTVTITDANGITGTNTVTVSVNPIPTLTGTANNGPLCTGDTLMLMGVGLLNVTGFSWRGPVSPLTDSTSDTTYVPGATVAASGIYTVTVVNGIGSGCTATYYDTALVEPPPTIPTVTGGGVYCFNDTIIASNGDSGTIYFQDTFSNGVSTATPDTVAAITYLGTHTYYFRAQTAFGCWGPQDSATVTINPLPTPDTAFGGGTFCDSTVITSSNGDSGTIYYQGTTANGTSITMGGSSHKVTTSGTYYFRAVSAAGCWGQQDSVTVTINYTPAPVILTGGNGTFCGTDTLTDTGGLGGNIYFEGNTSNGTDSSIQEAMQVVDTSGTYYFRAQHAGCWSKQDSAIVVINPLPATVIITTSIPSGIGGFCDSTTIFATNGGDGIIYYMDTASDSFSMLHADTTAFLDSENTAYYYHFRARNPVTGCWSKDTSLQVAIYQLPDTVGTTGSGGPFCGSTVITGFNDGDATINIYFEGNAPGGTSTAFGFPDTLHYTVDTSGTYYFRAQSTRTGCWSREGVSDDSATVHINPLPPLHNVTGGGSMCAGGAGFDIGLDGSDTGITYQLYGTLNGVTALGSTLTGTGIALDYGTDTAMDSFYVIARNLTTGCMDTTTTFAFVNVNPLPLLSNVSGGGPYCFGGSGSDIQVTFGQNFINYLVYDDSILETTEPGLGGPLDLGNFTDTGTYTVIAISDSGCTTVMQDTAVITTNPLPTVYTVTGGGTYCAESPADTGFHVFLNGSDSGEQYALYLNGAPVFVSFSPLVLTGTGHALDFGLQATQGYYTVIATNSLLATGCTNNMADTAIIIVNPQPNDQPMTGGGGYCSGTGGVPISLATSDSGISYELLLSGLPDGSPITGSGGPVNFPLQTAAGSYTVLATNPATGCTFLLSGGVSITINPLPTIYTVFGGGSYCIGGAGYNILLSGTQAGITYELFNGSTQVDSITGTGFIDSFGHQTIAGIYTVIGKSGLGCTSDMAGSATIVINSLPLVDTMTGGGSYCSGSTGVHVGLTGSTIGVDYQLSMGGSLVGGAVPGIGSALDFGILLPAGTYKASAINVLTGCLSNMADSAVITINPLPAIYAITGGGSYCSGGTGVDLGLSGSGDGILYMLYHGTVVSDTLHGNGLSLDYGLHTASGSYIVIARDSATGCTDSMSGSQAISINPLPPVHLLLGGGIYCTGGTGVDVKLSISDPGYLYLLYYDRTTTVGPPLAGTGGALDFGLQTLGGTYTVIAVDTATTCSDSMMGSAVVTVQTPFIPVVSITAHPGTYVGVGARDTLVAIVTDGGPDTTFQWYVNGNLVPGATRDTFAFNIYYNTDSITCQVTSHGICGDYTTSQSIFITLHNVGVSQVTTGSDIKLMPNPNKGVFTIKGSLGTTADEEVSVEVTDMLGQAVYKDKIMAVGGNIDQQIQLNSSLANGMYILNLRSEGQDNIFHFVVEQ